MWYGKSKYVEVNIGARKCCSIRTRPDHLAKNHRNRNITLVETCTCLVTVCEVITSITLHILLDICSGGLRERFGNTQPLAQRGFDYSLLKIQSNSVITS
jgi:hypothetical protein